MPSRPVLARTMPPRSIREPGPRLSSRRSEGEGDHGEPDGHVEPEDPVPGDAVDHRAADHRPERDAEAADPRPDPQGDPPASCGECLGEQGQRQRGDRGGADPLDRPGGDQRACGRRQRREGGAGGEDGEAGDEDPAPAEAVAERGAGDQQHREAERVGVDHPLQGVDAGAEVPADARQGCGDHEVVEGDHEERCRDEGEGPAGAGACHGGSPCY